MRLAVLEQLLQARRDQRPVVLVTRLRDGDQRIVNPATADALGTQAAEVLRSDKATTCLIDAEEFFLLPVNPPLRLIIVGAVHIAEPLITLAALCGYATTVIDPRPAFARAERFARVQLITGWPEDEMRRLEPDARTAIVALTHDPKIDDPALAAAVQSKAFYIGALGSLRTHEQRIARLRERGLTTQLQRIHAPIGLKIGAKAPAEIAVAIMAEMTAVLRQVHS